MTRWCLMEDIPQKLNVSETPISPVPLSPGYPLGAGRGILILFLSPRWGEVR